MTKFKFISYSKIFTDHQFENHYLYPFSAMIIALSMFVVGRFGFFDILGVKRLCEIFIFVPLGIMGSIFILSKPRLSLHPFFLLPLCYFVFQLYGHPDILTFAHCCSTLLVISIILALGPDYSDLILRYLIYIATFFAFLGIIEFLILLQHPDCKQYILLFYNHYSGSNRPVIENGLQLLGLSDGTSYHLWGMEVTRLRSFASEPSLLVGYFLVPGALSLTYHRKYILFGLICLCFCLCSFAASAFVIFGLSLFTLFISLSKSKSMATVLPFVLWLVFIWVLFHHFDVLISMAKWMGSDYDFLDKTHSAKMRFGYIRDFIPLVMASPFGIREELHQPIGFVMGSQAQCGIIGFMLAIIVLLKLFERIGILLTNRNVQVLEKAALSMVYASLITGLLYLDNCFVLMQGFTLLLLTYHRLNTLVDMYHGDGRRSFRTVIVK